MFDIDRIMPKLSPWSECKFSIRKLFGCFAPEQGDGKCSTCVCQLCCKETFLDFNLRLKEKDLH